jgi:hypothetical protein
VIVGQVTETLPEEVHTNAENRQAGDETDPGIDALRHNRVRQEEHDKAQQEDSNSVRKCDHRSEKNGVSGCAAGADEKRSHNGLTVTG